MGDYGRTILTLAGRIYELIPKHPEILELDEGDIFLRLEKKIPTLKLEDLRPSLMQVRYALAHARRRYRDKHPHLKGLPFYGN